MICVIVMISKNEKTVYQKNINTNNSTQLRLQELEQIYKNNLITKEEYETKRKKLLDNL